MHFYVIGNVFFETKNSLWEKLFLDLETIFPETKKSFE